MGARLRAAVGARVLAGAVRALAPRKREEVWEWAERRVVLSPQVTPRPGPFRARAYQKGEWSPFWAWRRFEEIDLIFGTQLSKTLMMQLTASYTLENDPGPGMFVFPNKDLCALRSKKHIRPFIQEVMSEWVTGRVHDMSTFEYQLKHTWMTLAWSGSAARIAGEPVKYLWMDEVAKFKPASATEPDSERNARERTKAFRPFHREWASTTPTGKDEPGWRRWPHSTQCQYWVPCHACGTEQVLYFGEVDRRILEPEAETEFAGGVKWDKDEALTLEERIGSAYYQCAHCPAKWNDWQVNSAVDKGRWEARNPKARRYAAHLNSIYAPSITLAMMVEKWFNSYKDPEERKTFLNSWLAVYYVAAGSGTSEEALKRRIFPGLRRGLVHKDAVAVFLTADVHDDHLRFRVRAWDEMGTTWGVDEGVLMPNLNALEAVLQRQYPTTDGGSRGIDRGLIDSNWRTDEVYQFCLRHNGVVFPVSGQQTRRDLYNLETVRVEPDPDKGLLGRGELVKVLIDDARSKDNLFTKIAASERAPTAETAGCWYLEEDVEREYLRQMRGEVKHTRKNRKGKMVSEWVQVWENHALDCEKYQLIAWHVFQVASYRRDAGAPERETIINPYTRKEVG